MELCRALGIAIPVGKDSMSMRTRWQDDGEDYHVVAPVSLIVSAFAPVTDVRAHLTPQLSTTDETRATCCCSISATAQSARRLVPSPRCIDRFGGRRPTSMIRMR